MKLESGSSDTGGWINTWRSAERQHVVRALRGLKPNYRDLPITSSRLSLTDRHTPHLFTRNSHQPSYPNDTQWTLERRGDERRGEEEMRRGEE
ncbi:hypothetical protein EYF80_042629 [Liparis tanakae]|uniref:Uncharacterized protein n=1 Tax=Liparis tanakae TaxID=230148 RepID=A0A4Z2G0Z1_9TELE|nr:hypothetical protein EYF80_042629 [Liparis tanakae]